MDRLLLAVTIAITLFVEGYLLGNLPRTEEGWSAWMTFGFVLNLIVLLFWYLVYRDYQRFQKQENYDEEGDH